MSDVKNIEKQIAIDLRKSGKSLSEISMELSISKSSASLWTRGVELTDRQKSVLMKKCHSKESIKKRTESRLLNEKTKRDLVINEHKLKITDIDSDTLRLIGTMLYWAEGGKTQRLTRFSNGDPEMIKIMMKFFREVCGVPEEKFRGHLHIHDVYDSQAAVDYWSRITDIPSSQFFKVYKVPTKRTSKTRETLKKGVFDIYVMDTKVFLMIQGWISGTIDKV